MSSLQSSPGELGRIMKEIERKFLVDWEAIKATEDLGVSAHLHQGYIRTTGGTTVRVRIETPLHPGATAQAYLTIKGKAEGISRDEFEYVVPVADAQEMLKLCETSLTKIRYTVRSPALNRIWVVDVFQGHLAGLAMAEVELDNANQQVVLPPWILKEVSENKRYSNLSLANCYRIPE